MKPLHYNIQTVKQLSLKQYLPLGITLLLLLYGVEIGCKPRASKHTMALLVDRTVVPVRESRHENLHPKTHFCCEPKLALEKPLCQLKSKTQSQANDKTGHNTTRQRRRLVMASVNCQSPRTWALTSLQGLSSLTKGGEIHTLWVAAFPGLRFQTIKKGKTSEHALPDFLLTGEHSVSSCHTSCCFDYHNSLHPQTVSQTNPFPLSFFFQGILPQQLWCSE